LARAHAAEVIFLHVVDSTVVEQLAQRQGDGESRARDRLFENGGVYLTDAARLAEEAGVPHREEIREGDPCTVICEAAAAAAADMVVMGKVGRRGPRRLLVGSVTRRVIEGGDHAVLVVSEPACG
jgi:nucleotide-binding universal stress UspA family protein